jgi:hypothetical protein
MFALFKSQQKFTKAADNTDKRLCALRASSVKIPYKSHGAKAKIV